MFNLDVSRDGLRWERLFRFVSPYSFQYPVFREYDGWIYFSVTQGSRSPQLKERVMFGRLCRSDWHKQNP